jgi:hypothetical protein
MGRTLGRNAQSHRPGGLSQEWESEMTNVRDTVALGIFTMQKKRKDISDVVGLIADLITKEEVKKEEGIYINFGTNGWWKISFSNANNKILIQCGEGGLTMFDSWTTSAADNVEAVWDALGMLITGVQHRVPPMIGRLKPFYNAGQRAEEALISAARM